MKPSQKTETLRESEAKLSATTMRLDELTTELDKSNDIDGITTVLERSEVSIKNTPNKPISNVQLSADDELKKPLKELNDALESP